MKFARKQTGAGAVRRGLFRPQLRRLLHQHDQHSFFLSLITPDTCPTRPLSLELRDTKMYEPYQDSEAKRVGNNLHSFKDFRAENGSSQGHNLALAGFFVPSSLDSGVVELQKVEIVKMPPRVNAPPLPPSAGEAAHSGAHCGVSNSAA